MKFKDYFKIEGIEGGWGPPTSYVGLSDWFLKVVGEVDKNKLCLTVENRINKGDKKNCYVVSKCGHQANFDSLKLLLSNHTEKTMTEIGEIDVSSVFDS